MVFRLGGREKSLKKARRGRAWGGDDGVMIKEFLAAHRALVWSLGIGSAVMFVASLIAIPYLVVRIPADYFAAEERRAVPWVSADPRLRWLLVGAKNLLGGLLVLLGIAMLVLPGQGLLSILIGLMLLDFPGKFRFERWLVSRGAVLGAINGLRRRAGRDPLVLDEPAAKTPPGFDAGP